jgi:hypothetical protein
VTSYPTHGHRPASHGQPRFRRPGADPSLPGDGWPVGHGTVPLAVTRDRRPSPSPETVRTDRQ